MAAWVNILNNDTGASVRAKLNYIGSDTSLSIRVVSEIAQVENEIEYFTTNTTVFAIAEQKFYYYDGDSWEEQTALTDIAPIEISHLNSPYSFTNQKVILANTSGGAVTINLLAIAGIAGRRCVFKNVGSGNLTLDANGTETIDGETTVVLTAYESTELIASSSEWSIL